MTSWLGRRGSPIGGPGGAREFEGEPGRWLPEQRRERSPLRDVAGLLRWVSYVTPGRGASPAATVDADWGSRRERREVA